MPPQDQPNIWALGDLCTPWCIHVVVTLRIAEHLDAGITQIDELAAAASADAGSLSRVLRHLVGRGVFEEPAPGRFVLNALARQLLDSSVRLGFDLDGFGGRMAYAWGSLLGAVRTGKPAYHTVFGRPFWEDLQAHSKIAESFDALMGPAGHGAPDPDVLIDGGWDSVRTVVDVGGSTGSTPGGCRFAPRPTRCRRYSCRSACDGGSLREGLSSGRIGFDRVTVVGQSFFDPLPAGADLYLLKNVLGDWPDHEAMAILTRCAARQHVSIRSRRPAQRRVARRGNTTVPGAAHDGPGGRQEADPLGVPQS